MIFLSIFIEIFSKSFFYQIIKYKIEISSVPSSWCVIFYFNSYSSISEWSIIIFFIIPHYEDVSNNKIIFIYHIKNQIKSHHQILNLWILKQSNIMHAIKLKVFFFYPIEYYFNYYFLISNYYYLITTKFNRDCFSSFIFFIRFSS